MHYFDVDPDLEYLHFELKTEDVFLINHFVSGADGDAALNLLLQSRGVLFELENDRESVPMASIAEMESILQAEVGPNPEELQTT